jgi:uncharacterized SAM-binding protein YcdF (DUF218 family)
VWLKALLELLLLPPVNLVFAILAGVALWRRAPRLARSLMVVGATLLLVLGMPAVGGTLLWSLEQGLPMTPPPGKPPQAIVILGGDVTRTAHGGATAGSLSLERERAGAILHRQTQLPILVTGGLIDDDPPPVADLMRDSLIRDFQVPVRWVEDRSRDTWQNARDSAPILRANGIDSIYLVTHAWHERRALMAFAGTGIAVTVAPVFMDRLPTPILSDFVPGPSAWLASYFAVHEWLGCLWYAMP